MACEVACRTEAGDGAKVVAAGGVLAEQLRRGDHAGAEVETPLYAIAGEPDMECYVAPCSLVRDFFDGFQLRNVGPRPLKRGRGDESWSLHAVAGSPW